MMRLLVEAYQPANDEVAADVHIVLNMVAGICMLAAGRDLHHHAQYLSIADCHWYGADLSYPAWTFQADV